jgi:hypothetical protein
MNQTEREVERRLDQPKRRLLAIALRLGRMAQEMQDDRVAAALRQARGSTVDAVRVMVRSGERE